MRLSSYFPDYPVPFIRHMLRWTVLSCFFGADFHVAAQGRWEKVTSGTRSRRDFKRIKKRFSPEYVEFLLIQMRHSPKVCAKCRNGSFTTLWLTERCGPESLIFNEDFGQRHPCGP